MDRPSHATLAEFINNLKSCQPVIPDPVAMHVMRKNGLNTDDPCIVRLISLATQKFVSDIALDAMQQVGFITRFIELIDCLFPGKNEGSWSSQEGCWRDTLCFDNRPLGARTQRIRSEKHGMINLIGFMYTVVRL